MCEVRCEAKTASGARCMRRAKIMRGGVAQCWQHDPINKAHLLWRMKVDAAVREAISKSARRHCENYRFIVDVYHARLTGKTDPNSSYERATMCVANALYSEIKAHEAAAVAEARAKYTEPPKP